MKIRNWKTFQHYKHRRPPWIRLYRILLEDQDWIAMPDDAKALLCELWMVASDTEDGSLPDSKALAWRLRRSEPSLCESISRINKKFLEDASSALAERSQGATSEKRREEFREEKSPVDSVEPPMPNPTPVPSWEGKAKAIWSKHLGGENDHVFGDLVPVVRRFGEEKTLGAWEAYCADAAKTGGKFASSRSFAAKPGPWMSAEPEKVTYMTKERLLESQR